VLWKWKWCVCVTVWFIQVWSSGKAKALWKIWQVHPTWLIFPCNLLCPFLLLSRLNTTCELTVNGFVLRYMFEQRCLNFQFSGFMQLKLRFFIGPCKKTKTKKQWWTEVTQLRKDIVVVVQTQKRYICMTRVLHQSLLLINDYLLVKLDRDWWMTLVNFVLWSCTAVVSRFPGLWLTAWCCLTQMRVNDIVSTFVKILIWTHFELIWHS